jgi:prepilin-type N-terminal cleavage/methylation domain-containing protein
MKTIALQSKQIRRLAPGLRPSPFGFSLIEMLWVIAIIGIVLSLTNMGGITGLNARYSTTKKTIDNKNIAAALLQHAKINTPLGKLPVSYTGGGYQSTVFDPATSALAQIFRSANIAPSSINDDGTSAQNVRVYQQVALTQSTPLDFQNGPLTTLEYQYAEVHLTACAKSNSCNTGIPGASGALTGANYQTWTTTGTDSAPEFFSTLPMQKQMLALTSQRLSDLRDKFSGAFHTLQLAAAATDTTNWYPYPYAAGVPGTPNPNMSPALAASTALGCWDGWYNLNAANVNVLAQLGLSKAQFGTTAWGGQIEYCRDYDPALRGRNSLPHYAALRIHQAVSQGIAATNVFTDDIFITF